MRSVDQRGVKNLVSKPMIAQQFEIAAQINGHGLMPIIEPEVTISIADKAEAEAEVILLNEILAQLDALPARSTSDAKADIANRVEDLYKPLVDHPRVMRVVALSGGYNRDGCKCQMLALKMMVSLQVFHAP